MNHTVRNGILLFALIAIVTFCTVYFTIDFTTWHALTYFSVSNIILALGISVCILTVCVCNVLWQ